MVAGTDRPAISGSDCRRWRADGAVRGLDDGRVVRSEADLTRNAEIRHRTRFINSAFRILHSAFVMYIELHCHSAFSFLDGASLPEQLALTASQLRYPALALTDHNGLYGSMAFAHSCQKLGLQAITGAELTLLDGSHVTLLAETPEGYANLC